MTEIQAVAVGQATSHLVSHQNVWLHRDALNAVIELQFRAEQAGFELGIASAFRDFNRQLAIWNAKFRGERPVYDLSGNAVDMQGCSEREKIDAIMLFSALPGASRHHLGSDFDVYATNLTSAEQQLQLTPEEYHSGPQAAFNEWLSNTLTTVPFYRPYARYQGGIAEEPWHISYYPVADVLIKQQSLDVIASALLNADIEGKNTILASLPALYERYITNLCPR